MLAQFAIVDYLPVLLFFAVAFVLSGAMIGISAILGPSKPDAEKSSIYECGFAAFSDSRQRFDVRFYLVSILFIIFDLEVAFLLPWAIGLESVGDVGFWSMMVFLFVLGVGLFYEWRSGALDWE